MVQIRFQFNARFNEISILLFLLISKSLKQSEIILMLNLVLTLWTSRKRADYCLTIFIPNIDSFRFDELKARQCRKMIRYSILALAEAMSNSFRNDSIENIIYSICMTFHLSIVEVLPPSGWTSFFIRVSGCFFFFFFVQIFYCLFLFESSLQSFWQTIFVCDSIGCSHAFFIFVHTNTHRLCVCVSIRE